MSDYRQHHLLYDGECDFCRDWAEWIILRDRKRRFRVCPWQVAPSPPMTPLLQVQAQRSVQIVTRDGRQLQGGRAVLFALQETNWCRPLVRLLQHRPFVWAVECGYRIVAANRARFGWLIPGRS